MFSKACNTMFAGHAPARALKLTTVQVLETRAEAGACPADIVTLDHGARENGMDNSLLIASSIVAVEAGAALAQLPCLEALAVGLQAMRLLAAAALLAAGIASQSQLCRAQSARTNALPQQKIRWYAPHLHQQGLLEIEGALVRSGHHADLMSVQLSLTCSL